MHWTHYLFSDWPEAFSEISKSVPMTSSSYRLYNKHVKDTQGWSCQVRALYVTCRQLRSKNMTCIFFLFIVRLRLITPISTLIMLDITKTESINCLLFYEERMRARSLKISHIGVILRLKYSSQFSFRLLPISEISRGFRDSQSCEFCSNVQSKWLVVRLSSSTKTCSWTHLVTMSARNSVPLSKITPEQGIRQKFVTEP